jgi:hypothetical protein
MRTLAVDPIGGVAGDMLLAALLDAGAPRDRVEAAVSSALRRPVSLVTAEVRRGGLRALALEPLPGPSARWGPQELLAAVEAAELDPGVRTRAGAVLERLLAAEARVHGVPLEELELDELGDDDTLLDVVGIAAALDGLGVERIVVSAIPLPASGSGSVGAGHGLPAPAVLELLRGFEVRASDAAGSHETVTPTGAAVLAALAEPPPGLPRLELEAVGTGAGRRDPAGVPNIVRVLLGSRPTVAGGGGRELLVLEANVDDLSPELVPDAVEALVLAGALDAWTTPIVMKRGRPGVTVSALCEPEALAEVRRAFFESTSTLGFRIHAVARPELDRRVVEIELADAGPRVRVKVGFLDGRPVSAKPEHDDVVEAARKLGRPVRAVHAEASALALRFLEERAW